MAGAVREPVELTARFCDALAVRGAAPLPADQRGALAEVLAAILARGQAAWPALPLLPDAFVTYLAGRFDAAELLAGGTLPAEDLYLACACALKEPRALVAFEAAFMPDVDRTLRRLGLAAATRDELKQELRARLFVGSATAAAKIGEFRGRGRLVGWLRAVNVRAALNALRGLRPEVPLAEAALEALPAPVADPELSYVRRRYGDLLRATLERALQSLSSHDRNLLRHVYAHRLSLDQLAVRYQLHRATVARRLAALRDKLVRRVRADLLAELALSSSELRSLMRLVDSQIDLSLHGLDSREE
jgi:RNA polymerase sigma-70 factor (ECF subfamily)